MKYFEGLHTLEQIKKRYHDLVKLNHPDVGGDTATMQEINRQYAEAVEWIRRHGERPQEREAAKNEDVEAFIRALAAIVRLEGIIVELVGVWVWASGNTYIHREALKAAGFRFSRSRRAWYWHQADESLIPRKASKLSFEELKLKHGCERILPGKEESYSRRALSA